MRQDPSLCGDVLWGARCLARVEADWAHSVLSAWEDGGSSLRAPIDDLVPA